jgi:hypothetical protein
MRFIDLTGLQFHRLKVLERGPNASNGEVRWSCVCICGTYCLVYGASLRSGKAKSCGCFSRERPVIHGLTHTPEYIAWQSMKERCLNPLTRNYRNYGGRGITVCERWVQSFQNFLEDMGQRPSPQHSLDRYPDNNGGSYEKANCRWATVAQQKRNTRRNRLLTFNGKTQCVTDWAAELRFPDSVLFKRIRRGWSVERALTTPVVSQPKCHRAS